MQEFNYSEVYAPSGFKYWTLSLVCSCIRQVYLEKEDPATWSNIRIATKYPQFNKKFLC